MKWFLRACPACGGDLHEDIEEEDVVACFMCARTFPRDQAILRLPVRRARAAPEKAMRPAAAAAEKELRRAA